MVYNEMIGWLGSILFAVCALPQAIHTYRTKKSDDLSELFLWLWFLGEVFTLTYILYGDIVTGIYHIPLYFNYIFNLFLLFYLLYAKYHYATKTTWLKLILNKVLKNQGV
ncbi:PQ-loop repeat-containing protein [Carboxylicivirga sp. RSCT41]|uniref:PQ-loop repeat-containing protein n=1 Tax=Carboxylicivirga agarovorans TaxID=3417570 RepID=UPI003D32F7EF